MLRLRKEVIGSGLRAIIALPRQSPPPPPAAPPGRDTGAGAGGGRTRKRGAGGAGGGQRSEGGGGGGRRRKEETRVDMVDGWGRASVRACESKSARVCACARLCERASERA